MVGGATQGCLAVRYAHAAATQHPAHGHSACALVLTSKTFVAKPASAERHLSTSTRTRLQKFVELMEGFSPKTRNSKHGTLTSSPKTYALTPKPSTLHRVFPTPYALNLTP